MDLPEIWYQHEVSAEPYSGTDGRGRPVYGTAVDVPCFQDDKRRLVRNPTTGEEVVSETTLYCALDTTALNAKGRVTLSDGRVATVLNVLRRDGGNLPLPSHLEVVLT